MTPIRELLKWESDLTQMFDSDQRVAMALLEKIRSSHKDLLEKEKEVIIASHINGQSEFDTGARSIKNDKLAEQYYNETFNTKEK